MGFISDMFSSKAPDVPGKQDARIEEERRKRRLAANIRGRQSTIYAGGGGVSDPKLLGRSVLTGAPGSGE